MTAPASTSAWIWEPTYSMYYNPTTRVWATVDEEGKWKYSDSGATNEEGAGQSGVLEEGEVEGGVCDIPEEQIWPGDDEEEEPSTKDLFKNAPLLRLVVKASDLSVLPSEQKIAVLDPAEPVSIGRDRSHDRRIRLKEMAISKVHATLFWAVDEEAENGGYWAVVDNGSTHGTRIKGDGEKRETRLSDSKIASVPSRLHHFDTLRCGSTSFIVHIHASFACSACTVASDSSNIIPLLPPTIDPSASKEVPSAYHTKTKEEKEIERREQIKGLKDKFLKPTKPTPVPTPSAPKPVKSNPAPFVDRAAARRARDAGSSSKPSSKPSPSPFFSVPGVTSSSTFISPASTLSKPDPFSSESKGAKLLSKMSGPTPSSSSSSSSVARTGLGTLIEARTFDKTGSGGGRDARPGLGSQTLVGIEKIGESVGEKRDWREDVREKSRKRFREMG